MTKWGCGMFVTPGVVVDGELVTTDLVDINLNIRILLGSSYYDDWQQSQTFVTHDPLGNPVDQRHPWNQTTIPRPQKRNFDDKYTWVMSPRWFDKRTGDHLALDTGGRSDRAPVGDRTGGDRRLWLAGEKGQTDMMLASPIIMYDYPQIAPESSGDLFDGCEIDEILALRILTLTDEEKQEVRCGDERARRILERTEMLPPEHFQKLHGAMRKLGIHSGEGQ